VKSKIIEKKFFNDLYELEVSWLFGGDLDGLKDFMRARHGANAKFYSWGEEYDLYSELTTNALEFHTYTPIGNADIFYIWMAEPDWGLLFHEAYHVPRDILHYLGMKLSQDSEEAAAYIHGWIGKKLMESLGIKFKVPKK
jgi:hypothetical protein